jgi:hypothetical protein
MNVEITQMSQTVEKTELTLFRIMKEYVRLEFPPHILGGLGSASYGLTRGSLNKVICKFTFVIPKPMVMKI